MTCCCLFSLKTWLMAGKPTLLSRLLSVLAVGVLLAGFQVTTSGRFWVTTEDHGLLNINIMIMRKKFSGHLAFMLKSSAFDAKQGTVNSDLHQKIQDLHDCLVRHMERYGALRIAKHQELVGQFIDRDGIESDQRGIYGTAGWLFLVSTPTPQSPYYKLWTDCKECLVAWTLNQQPNESESEISRDFNACVEELTNVIPKICAAWQALNRTDENSSADRLYDRVKKSHHAPEGKWGFLVSSGPTPISTALVVRTFRNNSHFANHYLGKALNFLRKEAENKDISNPFTMLYVLNTIAIAQRELQTGAFDDRAKIAHLIRNTIRNLKYGIHHNPTEFANPVPIEFNDNVGHRLRYLRFPGDLILLESLAILSTLRSTCFSIGPGARIWSRLRTTIESENTPEKDTTGDRLSISTCIYINEVLSSLLVIPHSTKVFRPFKFLATWINAALIFGPVISWNLAAFIFIAGIAIYGYWKSQSNWLENVVAAVIVLVSYLKELHLYSGERL